MLLTFTYAGCMKGDVTPDGSHFRSRGVRDPREQIVEDQFLAKDYKRDASGRFQVQPTPTPSMLPRGMSNDSKKSNPESPPQVRVTPPTERSHPDHGAPGILLADSTSTTTTTLEDKVEELELEPIPSTG